MRYGTVILMVIGHATMLDAASPDLRQGVVQEPKADAISAVQAIGARREAPDDPWMPTPFTPPPGVTTGRGIWRQGPFVSVQVNVDAYGYNIPGDAANEPSIAIDPTNPNTIVIGWRQFDSVYSNFRQAGWAYSHDAGQTWVFRGVLEPGVFRSDPVLDADADGNIYYYSLTDDWLCDLFQSRDGGVLWHRKTPAFGGDKEWFVIDRTDGVGRGNIYCIWSPWYSSTPGIFTRSTDGGRTFMEPVDVPTSPYWGTMAVGPDCELYITGGDLTVVKSSTMQDETLPPEFDFSTAVYLDGWPEAWGGPNPGGLLGQPWIAVDHSDGPSRGNVYLLSSVGRQSSDDPLDVMFARSTDGGTTWSEPVRVNDDPEDNGAWQWFGTMSVAPDGRIDAVWNDTRNTGATRRSELYYAYSIDGGVTWSQNVAVSPVFDSHIGWPNQDKIGDYYHMISDNLGANVAYAATFNGEQDVYYLRLSVLDCNDNGIPDGEETSQGTAEDCNGNLAPDECEPDFDADGTIDGCDDDMDGDGVANDADVCDFTPVGTPVRPDGRSRSDTDGNCEIDLTDYKRFRHCLLEGGPGSEPSSGACLGAFDCDEDTDIDLADFARFQTAFSHR